MKMRPRRIVTLVSLAVAIISVIIILVDAFQVGNQAQSLTAKLVEPVALAAFAVSTAARRYFKGLNPEGLPTPNEMDDVRRRNFSFLCSRMKSKLVEEWDELMHTGLVYDKKEKERKVLVATSGVVGLIVGLLTSTGLAALFGAALAIPGTADMAQGVIGKAGKNWDYWEGELRALKKMWSEFKSRCL